MIIRGRDQELALLDGLLDRARQGLSGVLVLRGAAGYGKTALLGHAAAAAGGLRVTEVSGVESEQELGFAALHRLVLPFLDGLSTLPQPQREALQTAFGLTAAPAADRFLVSLSALTLLSAGAAGSGLVVVCDDAQWLDRESLEVLAFVARRLVAEGVVMLFAVRDDHVQEAASPLDGMPELLVGAVPDDAARAMLADQADNVLDRVIAERIVSEAAGNPLAIRELARGIAAGDIAFGGEPMPLDRRLEARFRRQMMSCDPLVRSVLLVASADNTGDLRLVGRAAAALTGRPAEEIAGALDAAERDAFVTITSGGRLLFRHPLIRSAVHNGAAGAERRAVHAALAAATDATTDPDRLAWHLASASPGPDPAVADELAARSERARERGGHLAQAAMLHRAAELTPDPSLRAGRLLMACGAALVGGAPHRGEQLLNQLGPDLDPPVLRAHALRLRGLIDMMLSRPGAVGTLLEAARVLGEYDVQASREAYLEAIDAAAVAPRIGEGRTALQVAAAALSASPAPLDEARPEVGDLLLTAYATLIAQGYSQATPHLRRAVAALTEPGAEYAGAARWSLIGMTAAVDLWDVDSLGSCARRYARAARNQGALRMLQVALAGHATWALVRGEFDLATDLYAEFVDAAEATGADMHFARASDVLLHAWRGDTELTRAKAAVHDGPGADVPGGLQVQLSRAAVAVLEIGHRRYAEAQTAAAAVHAEDPPFFGGLALPDLVEAAVRNDDRATAAKALARLSERATSSGTPWALSVLARSRALLADGPEAEALFEQALSLLDGTGLSPERARTQLLFGEWLRRERRRQDAREQLRAAHTAFTGLGAAAFTERARIELAATGETARTRTPDTTFHLTAQEARVARMAAAGATNPEIATALFISQSTVEYHLRKVFRKTGLTTRRKLATVVGGMDRAETL
ncbi:helix-turn-helix transcriptional regulator [Streptacidiphilus griseoplanus]|uniref:helix-turn-helix transcriptional regulator n=1 Tax=Peterkaempfera griseoplana TaxID=66896 RepID=UPI0006E1F7F1|nr:LuxR family transcriptional regulator [Peterkaempfera griseoplana]